MLLVDPDRVGRLLRDIAREELLPRHRALQAHEIHSKATAADPDDIVTEADLAIERRLTVELAALLPEAVMVGEEAVAANPALLAALASDGPVFICDPLDGTKNFAAGLDTYGSMLALAVAGETRMAWIYLPTEDTLFVAEAGAGAYAGGRRLAAGEIDPAALRRLSGSLYTRHMPPELRDQVSARAARATHIVDGPSCSAIEYTTLARGQKDYVVYHRLHPWDHAPGALILAEAGGAARYADGAPYRATSGNRLLLLTRHAGLWPAAHAALCE